MREIMQLIITSILLLAILGLGFFIGINTSVVEVQIEQVPVYICEYVG